MNNFQPIGENTNKAIGIGLTDWQDVGQETASDDTRPPNNGPVQGMLKNVTRGRVEEAPRINYPMNAKSTGGVVGKPVYGSSEKSRVITASLNYDGGINASYNHSNLSAKFKNPQKKQDIEPVQRQYND